MAKKRKRNGASNQSEQMNEMQDLSMQDAEQYELMGPGSINDPDDSDDENNGANDGESVNNEVNDRESVNNEQIQPIRSLQNSQRSERELVVDESINDVDKSAVVDNGANDRASDNKEQIQEQLQQEAKEEAPRMTQEALFAMMQQQEAKEAERQAEKESLLQPMIELQELKSEEKEASEPSEKADEPKVEEPKADEPKADELRNEESKPEIKADEPKIEEPKVEASAPKDSGSEGGSSESGSSDDSLEDMSDEELTTKTEQAQKALDGINAQLEEANRRLQQQGDSIENQQDSLKDEPEPPSFFTRIINFFFPTYHADEIKEYNEKMKLYKENAQKAERRINDANNNSENIRQEILSFEKIKAQYEQELSKLKERAAKKDSTKEEKKPEERKADEAKQGENKPEERKADEAKQGENKPEERKPDEAIPVAGNSNDNSGNNQGNNNANANQVSGIRLPGIYMEDVYNACSVEQLLYAQDALVKELNRKLDAQEKAAKESGVVDNNALDQKQSSPSIASSWKDGFPVITIEDIYGACSVEQLLYTQENIVQQLNQKLDAQEKEEAAKKEAAEKEADAQEREEAKENEREKNSQNTDSEDIERKNNQKKQYAEDAELNSDSDFAERKENKQSRNYRNEYDEPDSDLEDNERKNNQKKQYAEDAELNADSDYAEQKKDTRKRHRLNGSELRGLERKEYKQDSDLNEYEPKPEKRATNKSVISGFISDVDPHKPIQADIEADRKRQEADQYKSAIDESKKKANEQINSQKNRFNALPGGNQGKIHRSPKEMQDIKRELHGRMNELYSDSEQKSSSMSREDFIFIEGHPLSEFLNQHDLKYGTPQNLDIKNYRQKLGEHFLSCAVADGKNVQTFSLNDNMELEPSKILSKYSLLKNNNEPQRGAVRFNQNKAPSQDPPQRESSQGMSMGM